MELSTVGVHNLLTWASPGMLLAARSENVYRVQMTSSSAWWMPGFSSVASYHRIKMHFRNALSSYHEILSTRGMKPGKNDNWLWRYVNVGETWSWERTDLRLCSTYVEYSHPISGVRIDVLPGHHKWRAPKILLITIHETRILCVLSMTFCLLCT